jgi:A/G-specific adenine glycosylase
MKPLPASARSFTRLLLRWYRRNARPLPWRATRDPYRVLVSEFMLQQTQVSRVTEHYGRFLFRYPTIQSLARAHPRAVRESWEGLGYYARAANLHRLARAVVREHRGRVPDDTGTLRTLPGVGPYTAGAVACFAFEKREAAVDTNVARVIRRVFTKKGKREPATANREQAEVWALARALLPRRRRTTWEFNQALMDLGATICVARKPRCPQCPVRSSCLTGA